MTASQRASVNQEKKPLGALEGTNPKLDLSAYRRGLGQFATGVTVITAQANGQMGGLTANSFTSVSLDPPLVLWSIKYDSDSFSVFKNCTHFAINVLSSEQIDISKRFARSGGDKFSDVDWHSGLGGSPILNGAIAVFQCRREAEYPGGDHLMFLGQVERFNHLHGEPLLFVQGRYGVPVDHPESIDAVRVGAGKTSSESKGPLNEFLSALMYRAYGELSKILEQGREAEGLNAYQSRTLAAIETFPDRTVETLMPELFLGQNIVDHTISELQSMGYLKLTSDKRLELTETGRERLNAMLEKVRLLEVQQLEGIPAEDVETVRRVLRALIDLRNLERAAS